MRLLRAILSRVHGLRPLTPSQVQKTLYPSYSGLSVALQRKVRS